MRKLSLFVIFLSFFLFAGYASATTYYIDYASGSDANSGMSKTSPWMHVPGMQGCTAVCASTAPKPGDSLILKGGITWPNAVFPILWTWSGTSGNNIYIGVDKTWYAGGSWARPIFNADGTPIAGSYNQFIRAISQSYVTWDNLEMTGLNWQTSYAYASLGCGAFNGSSNILISNWYAHGWSHTGGVTTDGFTCVQGDTNSPYMSGSLIDQMVFDGSDSTNGGDSGAVTYAWPQMTNSIIHNCANGLLATGHGNISGNQIYNINKDFDTSVHENAIETNQSDGTTYIYNNVIHDINYGEASFVGGNSSSQIIYMWNNVYYNVLGNTIHIEDRNSAWVGYFYNNTIVSPLGEPCFLQVGSSAAATLTLENNHCISDAGLDNISSPIAVTRTTNVTQTTAAASAQGFVSAASYVYAPVSGTVATVGAGTNATSSWPASYSTSDTMYGCSEISGSGGYVVSCPARTENARPSSGAWDVGAYFYSGATAARPQPPTGIIAIAR